MVIGSVAGIVIGEVEGIVLGAPVTCGSRYTYCRFMTGSISDTEIGLFAAVNYVSVVGIAIRTYVVGSYISVGSNGTYKTEDPLSFYTSDCAIYTSDYIIGLIYEGLVSVTVSAIGSSGSPEAEVCIL